MDDDDISGEIAQIEFLLARIKAKHATKRMSETVTIGTAPVQVVTHDGSAKSDGYDDPPSRCCQ